MPRVKQCLSIFRQISKYDSGVWKIFYQRAFYRYILAIESGCLAIVLAAAEIPQQFWPPFFKLLMQKLVRAHSLKMGLRLIVVVLLAFILVNLLS